MTMPLVSVKMITYNHAPYIKTAIESVLAQQTSFPFELLIGEDCSTDGTRDIVFEYAAQFPDTIRVVTSEANVGMHANSRRVGAALRGKYVAWCEGDDYWHRPDKLQKQVDCLEEHPDVGLVHSDYHRHYGVGERVVSDFNKTSRMVVPHNLSVSQILRGSQFLYILTVTVMVRRALMSGIFAADPILFGSDRYMIGDTQLWAEVASRSGTYYLDESLATYRVLAESASKFKDPVKQMKFGMNIHELFLYLVHKHGLSPVERRYHERKWAHCALVVALEERDGELAEAAAWHLRTLSLKERIYLGGAKSALLGGFLRAARRRKQHSRA